MQIHPTQQSIFLDCGKMLKYLERTQTDTGWTSKLHTEKRGNPASFAVRRCSVQHVRHYLTNSAIKEQKHLWNIEQTSQDNVLKRIICLQKCSSSLMNVGQKDKNSRKDGELLLWKHINFTYIFDLSRAQQVRELTLTRLTQRKLVKGHFI